MYVWYIMALAGSSLIFLKNRRITDRRLRQRLNLSDFAVTAVGLAIDFFLPASVGMLKGPVLLVLFLGYFYKTWHIYQVG